jgi:BON domain
MGTTGDIRAAVQAELSFDPLVDATDITVRNMNGEVGLNGTVPSYPQYPEAAAAAQRVSGVKNVHNHLAVVLPDADYRDDGWLTTSAGMSAPGPSMTRWSAPPGWPRESCRSATTLMSPADRATGGTGDST